MRKLAAYIFGIGLVLMAVGQAWPAPLATDLQFASPGTLRAKPGQALGLASEIQVATGEDLESFLATFSPSGGDPAMATATVSPTSIYSATLGDLPLTQAAGSWVEVTTGLTEEINVGAFTLASTPVAVEIVTAGNYKIAAHVEGPVETSSGSADRSVFQTRLVRTRSATDSVLAVGTQSYARNQYADIFRWASSSVAVVVALEVGDSVRVQAKMEAQGSVANDFGVTGAESRLAVIGLDSPTVEVEVTGNVVGGGGGVADGVVNEFEVTISGQTFTARLGRSGTLVDLVQTVTLPAGGSGVDQTARDAAAAAQTTANSAVGSASAAQASADAARLVADAATTPVQAAAQARNVVSDWAETGNGDAIPAAKLVLAPAGEGGGGITIEQATAAAQAQIKPFARTGSSTPPVPADLAPSPVSGRVLGLGTSGGVLHLAWNQLSAGSPHLALDRVPTPSERLIGGLLAQGGVLLVRESANHPSQLWVRLGPPSTLALFHTFGDPVVRPDDDGALPSAADYAGRLAVAGNQILIGVNQGGHDKQVTFRDYGPTRSEPPTRSAQELLYGGSVADPPHSTIGNFVVNTILWDRGSEVWIIKPLTSSTRWSTYSGPLGYHAGRLYQTDADAAVHVANASEVGDVYIIGHGAAQKPRIVTAFVAPAAPDWQWIPLGVSIQDVSAQVTGSVETHNTSSTAHADLRSIVETLQAAGGVVINPYSATGTYSRGSSNSIVTHANGLYLYISGTQRSTNHDPGLHPEYWFRLDRGAEIMVVGAGNFRYREGTLIVTTSDEVFIATTDITTPRGLDYVRANSGVGGEFLELTGDETVWHGEHATGTYAAGSIVYTGASENEQMWIAERSTAQAPNLNLNPKDWILIGGRRVALYRGNYSENVVRYRPGHMVRVSETLYMRTGSAYTSEANDGFNPTDSGTTGWTAMGGGTDGVVTGGSVTGTTLSLTRSVGDPVTITGLPSAGESVSDGVADAFSLSVSGQTLTGSVGRSGTLSTLSDTATLPIFDLHDDATTLIPEIVSTDRILVSDESISGDPNRYALMFAVQNFSTSSWAHPNNGDELPTTKIPNLNASKITAGIFDEARIPASIARDSELPTDTNNYVTGGSVSDTTLTLTREGLTDVTITGLPSGGGGGTADGVITGGSITHVEIDDLTNVVTPPKLTVTRSVGDDIEIVGLPYYLPLAKDGDLVEVDPVNINFEGAGVDVTTDDDRRVVVSIPGLLLDRNYYVNEFEAEIEGQELTMTLGYNTNTLFDLSETVTLPSASPANGGGGGLTFTEITPANSVYVMGENDVAFYANFSEESTSYPVIMPLADLSTTTTLIMLSSFNPGSGVTDSRNLIAQASYNQVSRSLVLTFASTFSGGTTTIESVYGISGGGGGGGGGAAEWVEIYDGGQTPPSSTGVGLDLDDDHHFSDFQTLMFSMNGLCEIVIPTAYWKLQSGGVSCFTTSVEYAVSFFNDGNDDGFSTSSNTPRVHEIWGQ